MANIGTRLDRELLTRHGWQMAPFGYEGHVGSRDGSNFVVVKIGSLFYKTLCAALRSYEATTDLASIVECGICVDFTSDTVHG